MSNSNARDDYVVLKSSIASPPLSRHSSDSDDSLRALEVSEGPSSVNPHTRYEFTVDRLHKPLAVSSPTSPLVPGHIHCRDSSSNAI